nr:aminoacetone oxidase family FAD-binding enzyme [Clostridia bacterium]
MKVVNSKEVNNTPQESDGIFDVIIIGCGASGLFAAASFKRKLKGLILTNSAKPALKLLMSGNGMCNLTHAGDIKDFPAFYGPRGKRIRSILYKYNNSSMCDFFEDNGLPLYERSDGKIFPKSMKARDVSDLLLGLAAENGFEIRRRSEVTSIRQLQQRPCTPASACAQNPAGTAASDPLFEVTAGDASYFCRHLILACGGRSYPTTGSNGSIIPVLEKLGIDICPQRPSLVPVFVQDYPYSELSGLSFKDVRLQVLKKKSPAADSGFERIFSAQGDLLFTHKSLSGPLILNSSRYIETGDRIILCYITGADSVHISKQLKKQNDGSGKKAVTLLEDFCKSAGRRLPRSLYEVLLLRLGFEKDIKAKFLEGKDFDALAHLLCDDTFSVSGTGSYNDAMCTCGGISLDGISTKTMELKKYPHMYAVGELLDVD